MCRASCRKWSGRCGGCWTSWRVMARADRTVPAATSRCANGDQDLHLGELACLDFDRLVGSELQEITITRRSASGMQELAIPVGPSTDAELPDRRSEDQPVTPRSSLDADCAIFVGLPCMEDLVRRQRPQG